MKSLIVLVLSLMSLASCEETFDYGSTNVTCIRARFDAQFNLSFTDSNGTHVTTFDLPPLADVEVDGNCPEDNLASLNLTFMVQDTSLIFTITNKDGQISGDLQVVLLDPSTTFDNVNYSSPVSLTGSDKEFSDMGGVNNSYLCFAPEVFQLSSNQSNISATAEISFMNLQFQAFNLPAQNFSAPSECAADMSSTASTTMITTTLPTPSGVGDYVVKNGTDICLRLKSNITISVEYQDKEGQQVTHDVMIPANAPVNGTCGDSEITMKLTIKPEDEYEALNDGFMVEGELNFIFRKEEMYTFIEHCDFSLKFNDSNSTIHRSSEPHDVLSLSSKPYMCISETLDVEMDEVVLRNLTVQAFDLTDGNFSKNGLDCNQLPPENPPSQNYTVVDGNRTCISMSAALSMKITYETTASKNETKTINLEKDEPNTGSCNDGSDMEHITILYKKDKFMIAFQFAKETPKVSGSLGADSFNYYVESINTTHTLDELLFPDAKHPSMKVMGSLNKQKLYETSSDKYYKCSTESSFRIDDSITVVTKDFRLIAFNTGAEEPNLFGNNANECAADTETNSVVPIAVGAALAGLVVIVLIAYLIGRRRNHKGYESV